MLKGREPATNLGANNLLRALRPEDFALLQPLLEPRRAERGTVLHQAGDLVEFAYFPLGGALASYVVVLSSGASVETALIGREGAIGGIVSQGHLPAYSTAAVVIGGDFLRIELAALEEAKSRSSPCAISSRVTPTAYSRKYFSRWRATRRTGSSSAR